MKLQKKDLRSPNKIWSYFKEELTFPESVLPRRANVDDEIEARLAFDLQLTSAIDFEHLPEPIKPYADRLWREKYSKLDRKDCGDLVSDQEFKKLAAR